MDIHRSRTEGKIWLLQNDYLGRLVKKFQMENSKQVSVPLAQHFKLSLQQVPKSEKEKAEIENIPYSNIVGSVMYSMICTRPDLAHAISVTSRYMKEYSRDHWLALKWIIRYIKGSRNVGILFEKNEDSDGEPLIGYRDSDFASNLDSRKSQTGYIYKLYGSAIS